MAIDGTRSTAAYSRFAEEMDIDSDAVEVNTRGGSTENGKLGNFKDCLIAKWRLWAILCLCMLSFLFGFLLTHVMVTSCSREPGTAVPPTQPSAPNSTEHHEGEGRKYADRISGYIKVKSFETNFRQYTSDTDQTLRHDSGSDLSESFAASLGRTWNAYGFAVQNKEYSVQLTRPGNGTEASRLEISNESETIKIVPSNGASDGGLLPPFVVNSPPTEPTGMQAIPIFINYGRPDDFHFLIEENGHEVQRRVCVFKLGFVQMPLLVERCYKHGGVGVIAFPDPQDYVNGEAYPEGQGLPENATIIENISPLFGDPKTPSLPSIDGVYDGTSYNITGLPTMVISQVDAARLLKLMKMPEAPESWQGGLIKYKTEGHGVYHIGGLATGFQDRAQSMKMFINNQVVQRTITNVFGTITGSVEPDRYVIFGCHRDSLAPGAVEPGTGIAVFMELSRLVNQLQVDGWQPRRTIIFASWDGGDDGHIGSTEWVEENKEILNQRAVVYVNLDGAVSGSYSFAAEGSPMFAKALLNATKQVSSPDADSPDSSVFDTWKSRNPGSNEKYQLRPLGVNSDATPFLHLAGIPSVDLQYSYSKNGKHIPRYPVWHTSYDTVDYIKDFIDHGWRTHSAMTDIAAHLLLMYAGDIVLPVDVNDYATAIKSYSDELMDMNYDLDISFDELNNCIKELEDAATSFHSEFILGLNVSDDMRVREANDRLVAMERAFLSSEGGTHMYPQLRHMIYGPSSIGAYDAEGLSPLSYALHVANGTQTDEDLQRAKEVMSVTTVAIHKAALALRVDGLFT